MKSIHITYLKDRYIAILPMPPRLNEYLNPVGNRLVKSSSFRKYQNDIKKIGAKCSPFRKSVGVELVVYRKQNSGDVDSRLKSLFDSLQGVTFIKDSQIEELHVWNKKDADDPRVELVCYEL